VTQPLTDDVPVLLGPVRVETRFTATELLVRVFPDEWSIEKFEPRPTQAEITALDAYWTARWAAAGDPGRLQAAWQELTGRIPPARATWLLHSRVPANPGEEPSGLPAGTTVLVVVAPAAPAAADRQPTVTYWTAVWRAHGDRRALRQADTALLAAVGVSRAATIRARRPAGLDAAPTATGDAVAVAFLVLPTPAAADIAPQSWTQAARARLLPGRFQVLGYIGGRQVLSATGAPVPAMLPVSPDPGDNDQLAVDPQTGALQVPDALRWLTDFDRAVAVGMGLRIPLTDAIRGGLDRLVVLGLRTGVTPAQSAADLADLVTRQLRSPNGYSLLPQGTPTNNTGPLAAGQDAADEADAALRAAAAPALAAAVARPAAPPALAAAARRPAAGAAGADWTTRTDGQQYAELLGLDPAVLDGMPNADRTDQRDARAANTALWPATWGYYLQTALHPLISPAAADATRDFFLRYVCGRGPLPAVKIGRQPYGLLPTTVFSKLAWPDGRPTTGHRRTLNHVLNAAAADWAAATSRVAHLGGEVTDAHQHLLDILALHPTSAEWYQRYAHSVEDIFNRENLGGAGPAVPPALEALGQPGPVRELLTRLGHPDTGPAQDPDLIRRLFVGAQQPLLAPLVDDRPLSETEPIRGYTADHRNYLRWLADTAGTDLDTVRLEVGFAADTPPATLLYLLARHAALLGWADAARRLAVAAGVASADELLADPPFVHVRIPALGHSLASESRWRRLYTAEPAITGDPDRLVADHIPAVLGQSAATAQLAEQVTALSLLADLPTARLERVLAEHLDLATYRLDAWRTALATERLAELRYGPAGDQPPAGGIHIGAYGWLEDVRPRSAQLTPVTLPDPLAALFPGGPLLHDPANEGFVHALSPAHARTAAVLRAGYAANGTPNSPGAFAVNLSSERVRVALTFLDGLRQGQSLGALLGYRLERGLHDRHDQAEVDSFIAALRQQFPLRAGKIPDTVPDPGQPVAIEHVEARNVVDGLALVRHVTRAGVPDTYPFGLDAVLPPADDAQTAAITAEVRGLLDGTDALADLAVAEGTHQALLGNTERASATLDAYAKEGFPPEPAVVRSPHSGITVTHRLGLRLTPGLSPDHGAPGGHNTPRAQAEPAVNDWLPTVLPAASDVVALVTWTDPVSGQPRSRAVTQADAGLAPIDLLWAVRPAGQGAMTDLDDRIVGVVVTEDSPRPDAALTIRYTQQVAGKVTFFEVSPLVAALRTLLTTSRPLRPSDQVPPARQAPADRTADDAVSLRRERPAAVRTSMAALAGDVDGLVGDLTELYPPPPGLPDRTHILSGIDTLLTRYAGLASRAAGFGMVRSGWGELTAWRRQAYVDVLAAVATVAARMTRALADADAILAHYDALPAATPDAERFRILQQAERLLTTTPSTALPNRPNLFRIAVGNLRRDFDNRLQGLDQQARTSRSTLSGLLAEVAQLGPQTDLDPTGLDLTPFQDRVVAVGRELLDRAGALAADIAGRLAAADAALAEYDQAVTGPDRVQAGTDALAALLGPDVLVVPEYAPPAAAATEWRTARDHSDQLLAHLTAAPIDRDFPVDDWLHGVARVREMARLWEKVMLLSDALRGSGGLLGQPPSDPGPALTPIQLPYHAGDHWLGLEFAAGTTIAEDKLLFTAHYADEPPVNPDAAHCGLLLDEWTELIPAATETTGIAVHVDRPDSEPPQALLLVAPPVRTGAWDPADLVAAVMETLDLARSRAVEPGHLDGTAYAQLLPATVLSATRQQITISTDLAVANLRWKANHD
jgi:hypothetical protein